MSKNRNLLEILLDLHENGRSGVLRVERGSEKKQLVLCKGTLVFAESNVPGDHLARIMVKMGLMPGAKVNEVASLMKKGKTSEEAVLALPDSDMQSLEKGRREQAVVILASLLAWDRYDVHYYPGEDLVRTQVNLGLHLPELIVLSARRAVSDHLIPTPPDFLQGSLCISESFAGKAMEFPLDSAESYAYSLLHEPMNTADVLSLVHAAEGKPEELLLRLSVLGLITLKKPVVGSGGTSAAAESNSLVQILEEMLLSFESANFYEILSAPTEASQDEIQAAYHELAKQLHPDRFQSKEFSADARRKAEKVFTYINEAYVTLKDPTSRALYDEKRLTKESKVEVELKARAAKQSEDEKMAEALYREGRILLAKGDSEKAVERLKGSVWLCPEKAAYHHYLGVAQSEIPQFQKSAEQNLLKAIELDSLSTASHLELAKLYRKVLLYRKAEMQLREFMHYDPDNPEAHRLLYELKKLEKASAGRSPKPA
jgi:curved DNA-binding protein CbpA